MARTPQKGRAHSPRTPSAIPPPAGGHPAHANPEADHAHGEGEEPGPPVFGPRRSAGFPDACPATQHEATRGLLTKYSHEKTYRLREALAEGDETAAPKELESVQSDIPEAPQ
jgi:hypothetical protein